MRIFSIKKTHTNLLSPSLRSVPVAPSATPEDPEVVAAASSVSGPARLSMLLAADRQDGVEAGEMTEALTTVAWGLKQLGRASGGMASISRARISSACNEGRKKKKKGGKEPDLSLFTVHSLSYLIPVK